MKVIMKQLLATSMLYFDTLHPQLLHHKRPVKLTFELIPTHLPDSANAANNEHVLNEIINYVLGLLPRT